MNKGNLFSIILIATFLLVGCSEGDSHSVSTHGPGYSYFLNSNDNSCTVIIYNKDDSVSIESDSDTQAIFMVIGDDIKNKIKITQADSESVRVWVSGKWTGEPLSEGESVDEKLDGILKEYQRGNP